MSRNFYILAGTLGFFGVLAMLMAFVPHHLQPGLPANALLWRSVGLLLLLGGLVAAFIGVMSNLFEQVDRRTEARRQSARAARRSQRRPGGNGNE
jgi:uncharacterized membrane protein